jgi:hypothetical protein
MSKTQMRQRLQAVFSRRSRGCPLSRLSVGRETGRELVSEMDNDVIGPLGGPIVRAFGSTTSANSELAI